MINYIGKTSNWKNELNNLKENEIAYQSIMDYVVLNRKPLINIDDFIQDDKLNIFSEEMLSSTLFWQMKRSMPSDPKTYPEKIAEMFKNHHDKIVILITLRNQTSFIYSAYSQSFRYFYKDTEINDVNKFIDYFFSNKHLFRNFYYDQLIESWEKVFKSDRIKILLFEDFINDKKKYYDQLAEILSVSSESIQDILDKIHYNKKDKDAQGYLNSFVKEDIYKNPILSSLKKTFIYKLYKLFLKKYPNNFLFFIKNKIVIKNVKIPFFNEDQKAMIKNEFSNSNMNLIDKYGIEIERLKKYNYV